MTLGSVREVFLTSEAEFLQFAYRMKSARMAPPSNMQELKPAGLICRVAYLLGFLREGTHQ